MGCGVGGAEEVWRDGEEKGGRRQVYDWQGKRKAPKKRRRFTLTPLRTWEVCGGSALTLGLNLSETPGLANLLEGRGCGGAFTSFEVRHNQKKKEMKGSTRRTKNKKNSSKDLVEMVFSLHHC